MGAAAFVLNETGIRGIRLDDAAEVSDGIAAALAHNGPGVVVLVCGAILIVLASRLRRSKETGRQAAHRLFVFSISYLFVLFAALLASNSGNRWSPVASARASPTAAALLQAESLVRSVQAAPCPIRVRSGEV